ncbi:Ankyrin repeat protein [Penicillium argentinense]|uniref:Ankyrin repeat protein n=1 Tax=Penicillium argentinense TaxID=1131581 RepID=A0A9W9G0D1_9EURO|nr:Ankyrin repeat protein [Penicillium argentinense]KAJ5109653.1 Ankyrin repeat protein [Penicillium argentinense]
MLLCCLRPRNHRDCKARQKENPCIPARHSNAVGPKSLPATDFATPPSWENAYEELRGEPAMVETLKRLASEDESELATPDRDRAQRKRPRLTQRSPAHFDVELDLEPETALRALPLHLAVKSREDDIVKVLLEKGADVEQEDAFGRTALFYAAAGSDLSLRLILERDANVNHKDRRGMTPLLYAVYEHRYRAVSKLLERGADVNAVNIVGDNALRLCVDIPSPKNAFVATIESSFAAMHLLLQHGADLNISSDAYDSTPVLNIAAFCDFVDGARLLLENGANIEEVDLMDRTPLLSACNTFKTTDGSMIKLLLQQGAEAEHRDYKGRTALSLAASRGQDSTVHILLDHGAHIEARDLVLRTPLMHAALEGWVSVTTILLQHGAKVDVMQRTGLTPLGIAIKALRKIIQHSKRHSNQRHVKVIGTLLLHGADTSLIGEDARRLLNGITRGEDGDWRLSEKVVADLISEAEA